MFIWIRANRSVFNIGTDSYYCLDSTRDIAVNINQITEIDPDQNGSVVRIGNNKHFTHQHPGEIVAKIESTMRLFPKTTHQEMKETR